MTLACKIQKSNKNKKVGQDVVKFHSRMSWNLESKIGDLRFTVTSHLIDIRNKVLEFVETKVYPLEAQLEHGTNDYQNSDSSCPIQFQKYLCAQAT